MYLRAMPSSQAVIMVKVLSLYDEVKEQEDEGSTKRLLMASRGWFDRFERHSNLDNIHITGEAVSVDE